MQTHSLRTGALRACSLDELFIDILTQFGTRISKLDARQIQDHRQEWPHCCLEILQSERPIIDAVAQLEDAVECDDEEDRDGRLHEVCNDETRDTHGHYAQQFRLTVDRIDAGNCVQLNQRSGQDGDQDGWEEVDRCKHQRLTGHGASHRGLRGRDSPKVQRAHPQCPLKWLSELLQTLPAILVYFLFFWWIVEGRLLLLTVVIGLVSWGGMARLVRNEALERSSALYVRAAEGSGASQGQIVWNHLLPNIAPTVVTAVTLQVPLFILVEASVSFIQVATTGGAVTLGDPTNYSWGQVIYIGLLDAVSVAAWWVAGIPVAALICTILAFNLVGNGLTDALSP